MTGPRPVPWIAGIQPATHGAVHIFPPIGPTCDGPGGAPILDFSANGNVIGPSPATLQAITNVDVSLFPDRHCTALRQAIAAHHRVPVDWIVPGNGSTEIIWAAARAFLAPGDATLVVEPTYGEYAVACQAAGAQVHRVRLDLPGAPESRAKETPSPSPSPSPKRRGDGPLHLPPWGRPRTGQGASGRGRVGATPWGAHEFQGQPDLPAPAARTPRFDGVGAIAAAVERLCPRVVWLCNPNNPTGALLPSQLLPELLQLAPSTLYVVDEAYLTLATDATSAVSLAASGQVLVIRSLTKDAALAGLRLGYGVAHPSVASAVAAMIPPWSVSSVAQAAGLAAMADPEHLARARLEVARSRAHLLAGLCRLGLEPYPTATNFVLVPVGSATAIAHDLLGQGIAVRDATSFGLPSCIRIGVRSIADQERLLAALGTILKGGGGG